MGWFTLPNGAVTGDDPADLMQDALLAYASRCGKPAFTGFLDALAHVLSGDTAELLDGPGLTASDHLRARFGGGPGSRGEAIAAYDLPDGVSDARRANGELTRALDELLAAVAASYVQGYDRRCTLRDVLATVLFSFGRQLSTYFADRDGIVLEELVSTHD